MLIRSTDIVETIETAGQFGIHAYVELIDWQPIILRVADEIHGDARAVEEWNQKAHKYHRVQRPWQVCG